LDEGVDCANKGITTLSQSTQTTDMSRAPKEIKNKSSLIIAADYGPFGQKSRKK
jgi:hypothetical protein